MFATLLGGYPPSPAGTGDADDPVRTTVEELDAAGLELIVDGLPAATPGDDPAVVADRWRRAAEWTGRAVKQAVVGPYSFAALDAEASGRTTGAQAVEALAAILEALVSAGCPLVDVEEPAASAIGEDAAARRRFVDLHRSLAAPLAGRLHLSLVVTGGNADTAGAATFFDLPYASYAFDLIAGPDNWRLIAEAPGDRGIVCGALDPSPGSADRIEELVWAAHYAASTRRRGLDRVGLANASSLAGLPRERARTKVARLAEAARLATAPTAELAAALDPRAVDARSAALGRFTPRRRAGSRPRRRR